VPDPTNTPPPPAPTNTPLGGGVAAGGVQPPETGTGPSDSGSQSLLMIAGIVMAIAGAGTLLAGTRRS
jgi:hypothetical protein